MLRELVERFFGRSKEDAEKIVASLRPAAKSAVRDRVVPVAVATASAEIPLFANAQQNSSYLRANAQSELRKCEEACEVYGAEYIEHRIAERRFAGRQEWFRRAITRA